MKKLQCLLFIIALATLSFFCVGTLYQLHSKSAGESLNNIGHLPGPLVKAFTFEFSGVASDFLMLKVLSYLGEKLMNNEQLSKDEWQIVYLTIKQIVTLDTRFLDAYTVAQTTLPFEAGMVKETNQLLEQAAEIMTTDYRPNFFLWYNYFYFLNDAETAGKYLEKAARMPGAPPYFSTLAARMNLYAGKIRAAILFLEETAKDTSDPSLQKFLSMRIEALKKIGYLEYKVSEFRKQHDKSPKNLQELVDYGLIPSIPTDPYGGEFYITKEGRVYSTSALVLPKKKEK
jgi:hypothetical protein